MFPSLVANIFNLNQSAPSTDDVEIVNKMDEISNRLWQILNAFYFLDNH